MKKDCQAIEMLDLKAMRGRASVICDLGGDFLTVQPGKTVIQYTCAGIGRLVTACENVSWLERVCRVARKITASARKADGGDLIDPVIDWHFDAEILRVLGIVRASSGWHPVRPTRKLVPTACTPKNIPPGILAKSMNGFIP